MYAMNQRIRLPHLAVLRASGDDTLDFLQGQLSNDVTALDTGRAQLTSFNSPKGRVLAVIQAVMDADQAVLLTLPASIAEAVHKRMSMYILRSRVTLERTGLGCFGLAGEAAADRAKALHSDALLAWPVPADAARWVVAGAPGALDHAWDACAELAEGGIGTWRRADILAGLPEIVPETQDMFVAQMLRLDDLGAINFSKGCYTGQEVIARAHYRGKVKRRSATGRMDSGTPLEPGATLTDDAGKTAATVVQSAPDEDGGQVVLAVLHREFPEGTVLKSEQGATVRF